MYKHFIVILTLVFFINTAFSQKKFTNEIGVYTGISTIFSDYFDYESITKNNSGYTIGIIHYMNFLCSGNCSALSQKNFFNDHFKIRNEFSYKKINLKHYAVTLNNNLLETSRYNAMSGQTIIYQLGSNIEFYPWSIRNFESGGSIFLPSVSLGAFYSHYKPNNSSSLGILGDPAITPSAYVGHIKNEIGSTFSFMGSLSTRIKLSPAEDLLLQGRGQYFFSDYIEGIIQPNTRNDILFSIVIGYIYYLD